MDKAQTWVSKGLLTAATVMQTVVFLLLIILGVLLTLGMIAAEWVWEQWPHIVLTLVLVGVCWYCFVGSVPVR